MRIKFFFFLLLIVGTANAQNVLNLPVLENNSQVRVINMGSSGLMVLDKSPSGDLKITKVDTTLAVVWETQIDIIAKASFVDDYFDGRFVYLILEPKNQASFSIVKISSAFPAYQKFDFPLMSNFQYGFFAANDQVICLGGSVKDEPFIAIKETFNESPTYISGNAKGTSDLQSIHLEDGKLYVSLINSHKKANQIIFREYDYSGKVISSKNLTAAANHNFLSARFFQSNGQNLLVGNYGLGKIPSTGYQSSQGIFITNLERSKTKYYSFANFNKIFSFLSDKQKDRIDRQVKKKKEKGEEYSFDYRLHISGLLQNGKQTLITGEVFQPEYRNRNFGGVYGSPFYSNYYWGRPSLYNTYWLNSPFYGYNSRNNQYFDGFKYLEGIVFAIDGEGNLSWDNSFPYKSLKYYDLTSHLKVSTLPPSTLVLYTNESKLQMADISSTGEVIEKTSYNPKTLELISKDKKAEFANFGHWHDSVFYNWGVMKTNGRNTCFIQKIEP